MEGIERLKLLANDIKKQPNLKIVDYLVSRNDMNEKYLNEEKSLNQMFEFITQQARKKSNGDCVMIDDDTVFGWAIHYWDEPNDKLGLDKPSNIQPKKNSKEEKNKETLDKVQKSEEEKIKSEPISKEEELTLLDFEEETDVFI